MGPRILSETPIPSPPDIITIDDDADCKVAEKQNIDSWNKQKKDLKPVKRNAVKAVKDMTEEEIRKELAVIDKRRDELLKTLADFEKAREEKEQKKRVKEESKPKPSTKTSQSLMSMDFTPAMDTEDRLEQKQRPKEEPKSSTSVRKTLRRSMASRTSTMDTEDRFIPSPSPTRRYSTASIGVETPQSSTPRNLLKARRSSIAEKLSTTKEEEVNKENQEEFSPIKSPPQKRTPVISSGRRSLAPTRQYNFRSPQRMSLGAANKSPFKQHSHNQVNDQGDLVQVFDNSAGDTRSVDSVAAPSPTVQEIVNNVPELPYSADYDPVKSVAPHKISFVMHEMYDKYKSMYYQPDLSDNTVKVPFRQFVNDKVFYLFEIPAERIELIKRQIRELGGEITSSLCKATRVIFFPNDRELAKDSLFLFATAAAGGRFLLPINYIGESYDRKKFIDINTSLLDSYDCKYDLHPSTQAAIKMANSYRTHYFQNRYSRFNRANVLLAVQRREHEDIKLLLMILGAYVQRCWDNKKYLKNPLYTLCVTDGTVDLSNDTKMIPKTEPQNIRDILWTTLEKFK